MYEKNYIAGRYGAIPYLGDIGAVVGANNGEEEGESEDDDSDLPSAFSGELTWSEIR
jgi:hypothetical protein